MDFTTLVKVYADLLREDPRTVDKDYLDRLKLRLNKEIRKTYPTHPGGIAFVEGNRVYTIDFELYDWEDGSSYNWSIDSYRLITVTRVKQLYSTSQF
jgi:hypothetical protein